MKNRLLILALLVLALVFVSCGEEKMTFDEAREVLPTLVEKSLPLNEIYFGYGFMPSAAHELEEVAGYYYADCSKLGLYSISEIKDATVEVFTPEYAAILYAPAFDGVAAGETVVPPKFMEGEKGIMQSMSATVYDLPKREYRFDTLNIVKSEKDRMTLSLESEADGNVSRFEVILVRTKAENGGYTYRLDSPTY